VIGYFNINGDTQLVEVDIFKHMNYNYIQQLQNVEFKELLA
jgi:hypothetical protein